MPHKLYKKMTILHLPFSLLQNIKNRFILSHIKAKQSSTDIELEV